MTPGTMLLLTFAGLTVGLFAALWGLGLFLQGYLYSEPASKMPLRALGGAVILAAFLTFWVQVNTRAETKDRYGTLFEFNPTSTQSFQEFQAIRKDRQGKESTVAFQRVGGGTTAPYVEPETQQPFRLTTADYVTVALDVKVGETTTRFDAELDDKGKYKSLNNKVFTAKDRRFIEFGQTNTPSLIFAPSRGAFFAALALNALNFILWFAVFWPVLRFSFGHAIGLAFVFGGVTMLLLMPLLFDKNQVRASTPPAPAAASAGLQVQAIRV